MDRIEKLIKAAALIESVQETLSTARSQCPHCSRDTYHEWDEATANRLLGTAVSKVDKAIRGMRESGLS